MQPHLRSHLQPHPIPRLQKYRQCGFLLESIGLALLILSTLALLKMNKQYEEDLNMEAKRRGQALTTVRNLGNTYIAKYWSQLLALENMDDAMPVTIDNGITSIIVEHGGFPQIEELEQLGLTPPHLIPQAIGGGNYTISIHRVPAGCDAASNCNLEGLITIDKPYVVNGTVDYPRLGLAAAEVGSDSAFSHEATREILSGFSGKWSVDNPVLNQPAGILAARIGFSSSVLAAFYRRDGSTPLSGTMDANQHAIKGVSKLSVSGNITSKTITTAFYNQGDSCDGEENAFARGALGTVVVCLSGRWQYTQHNPVAQGAACSPDGMTGTSTSTGETLMCKRSSYVRINNLIARNVQVGRVASVHDDSVVPIPECETGGIPDNSLLMTSSAVEMNIIPPMQSMETFVSRIGTNWKVSIKLIDSNHVRHSANRNDIYATLNLECKY